MAMGWRSSCIGCGSSVEGAKMIKGTHGSKKEQFQRQFISKELHLFQAQVENFERKWVQVKKARDKLRAMGAIP